MSRSLWPRWSRMSQVERVDVYTRQSLFLLLVVAPFVVLPNAIDQMQDHPATGSAVVALSAVLTAVAAWVLQAVMALHPAPGPVPWPRVGALLGLVAVSIVVGSLIQDDLGLVLQIVAWAAVGWSLGGLTDPRLLAALLVGLTIVPLLLSREPVTALVALGCALFFVFTVRASLWLLGVVVELDRTRTAQGELAVAEERLRFSRDVHDVLGRHLSAIAVQAELGARLAERGDDRAAATMLEVRAHAHDALKEARELARGYRSTSLERELEGARSLLQAAGIATVVDVDDLDPAWHEATAWVVRETVTNVLRHSRAEQVSITYADGVLVVRNDGATGPASTTGSGLAGLRDRLATLGATLTTELDGREFVVRTALP